MKFNVFVFFLLIACLPAMAQTQGMTVERTELVQVSSGEDSPNINKVNGNVIVIVFKCINVTNCGSDFISNSAGTYSIVSRTATPLYLPITSVSLSSSSGIDSGHSASISNTFSGNLSLLQDGYNSGLLGETATQHESYSGLSSSPLTGFDVSKVSLYTNSQTGGVNVFWADTSKMSSVSSSTSTPAHEIPPFNLAGEIGQDRTISGVNQGNDFGTAHLGVVDLLSTTSTASYNSASSAPNAWAGSQSALMPLYTTSPSPTSPQNPLFGNTVYALGTTFPNSVETPSTNNLVLDTSVPEHNQYLKVTSYDNTDMALGIGLNTAQYAMRPPTNFATGFDNDSLSQQLENLSKSKKKIVGWTLITEEEQ